MEQSKSRTQKIKGMIGALLCAWLVTGVLLLVLALLLWKLNMKEGQVSIGITVTYLISCFAGGWVAGRNMQRKKFLFGLMTGGCYFVLLLGVSVLAQPGGSLDVQNLMTSLILCAAGGMAGGMLS